MPKEMERKLKAQARKKRVKDEDAYVYGTMRKAGWKPKRERKPSAGSRRRTVKRKT